MKKSIQNFQKTKPVNLHFYSAKIIFLESILALPLFYLSISIYLYVYLYNLGVTINIYIFIFEGERQSVSKGRADREERETHNLRQALGCKLSAQRPTRGLNSQTARS